MDVVDICEGEIDMAAVLYQIRSPSSGGTASYLGTTRDNADGRRVLHLEYEAYQSMALKELRRLCEAMRTRWPPLTGVAVVHRMGVVPVAEASVLVAASAPHRREALEAVAFGIDYLKEHVPIWKKEVYDDGSYLWKGQ